MAKVPSKKCCAYCGHRGKLTIDHVPPKCLFASPIPNGINLITVPACGKCHEETTLDDEYFRTVLALRHDTFDHPDVKGIIPAVMRAFSRADKVKFARAFFAQQVTIDARSPGGVYLGKKPGYRVDMDRVNRVTSRITVGLYYRETRSRLPDGYTAVSLSDDECKRQPRDVKENIRTLVSVVGQRPRKTIGENVFCYQFAHASDEPFCSVWLMTFYGRLTFMTLTMPTTTARLKPRPRDATRIIEEI